MGKRGDWGCLIGRMEGGMATRLHALADANGCALSFLIASGEVGGYTGAAALLDDVPKRQRLLGERGNDTDWFRDALRAKAIQPCIPGRRSRNEPVRSTSATNGAAAEVEIMAVG